MACMEREGPARRAQQSRFTRPVCVCLCGVFLFVLCYACLATAQLPPEVLGPGNTNGPAEVPKLSISTVKPDPVFGDDKALTRFTSVGVSFHNVPISWIATLAFSPSPNISFEDDRVLGLPS